MAQKQTELKGWKKPALGLLLSLVLANIFGSWAIDSGNAFAYALTMLTAYTAVRFLIQLAKNIFSHEQTSKTRRARKAH